LLSTELLTDSIVDLVPLTESSPAKETLLQL
jgi:hypothetical protein